MVNRNAHWVSVLRGVCVALLWLTSCSSNSAKHPLQIIGVSISPEPRVGQIVTLEVQIMSTKDEADVSFLVNTLEKEIETKLRLVGGEAEWRGPLKANEVKTFRTKICVAQEGGWPIEVAAYSRLSEDQNKYLAFETIHLESTINSGRLIRSREYTFSQEEATRRPTPIPIQVSPECSGQQE